MPCIKRIYYVGNLQEIENQLYIINFVDRHLIANIYLSIWIRTIADLRIITL